MILWAVIKFCRWLYRRATGYQDPTTKILKLWHEMADVYKLTAGPVINPTMLRDALLKTRDAGAVWVAPLYVLVERIIARDASAWVISDRYAYKKDR